MKIYLMRHGLTPLNKLKKVNGEVDEPLAPEGIEQAKDIIPFIPKSVKYIYSSPLLRARQTAEAINSKLRLPLIFQDEITEIRMGTLAGKSWEEMDRGLDLKKKHRTVQFDYRTYGGESVEDVKARLVPFLKKIKDKYGDDEVLFVTHAGIIRIIKLLETGEAIYESQKHVSLLTCDLENVLNIYN